MEKFGLGKKRKAKEEVDMVMKKDKLRTRKTSKIREGLKTQNALT